MRCRLSGISDGFDCVSCSRRRLPKSCRTVVPGVDRSVLSGQVRSGVRRKHDVITARLRVDRFGFLQVRFTTTTALKFGTLDQIIRVAYAVTCWVKRRFVMREQARPLDIRGL